MRIDVKFSVEINEDATPEQIQEWLEFELGARGGQANDNPIQCDIEAKQVTFD